MTKDESVREALLELQFLRERETEILSETQSLLSCLEAYTGAGSAADAMRVLFRNIKVQTGATLLVLLEHVGDPSRGKILASSMRGIDHAVVTAPVTLFSKTRNLRDMNAAGTWYAPFSTEHLGAAIAVPGNLGETDVVLLAFKPAPEVFSRADLRLVERLVGLVARARQSIDVEAQNSLLSATIEGSSSGFAISDARNSERPLVYVNKAFEAITGYSPKEVLGQNCRFMSAEPKTSPERTRLRDTVAQNGSGEFVLRNKTRDGREFWNELSIFPVMGEDGDPAFLVATQTDVTSRIVARKDRDQMRQQMEQALTATEDSFLILDAENKVVFANDAVHDLFPGPAWAKASGFEENWAAYLDGVADMPGRITGLLKAPDLVALTGLPNGREVNLPDGRIVLIRSALLPDGGLTLSATNVTRLKTAQTLLSQRLAAIEAAGDGIAISDDDGRLVYANSACTGMLGFARPTRALGQYWYHAYVPVSEGRRPRDTELTLPLDSDRGTGTHEITQTPLPDGGYVIVFRDVTEALETELREQTMQDNLQRLQKEHATSQLASGIAHDFNNLLSAINGSATLIGMDASLPDRIRPHLDRIQQAGQQSAALVNRLLDVGAVQSTKGTFTLSTSLDDVQSLVAPGLPEQISLVSGEVPDDLVLAGDAGAFSQAIMNILLNAKDAIGLSAGQISLVTSKVDGTSSGVPGLLAGQHYARIDIEDTGAGMDEVTQSAIFERYFTTKGRKGTGLGLAMVAMQIEAIKGAIQVQSEPGNGTIFSVFWPLAATVSGWAVKGPGAGRDLKGATIIVVDDDTSVGRVISEYLEAVGAEVATCEDPADALEAVREDPGAWSAIVTDYDMPGMNGGALAQAIRDINPDLPIVLVTALARRLNDPRVAAGKVAGVLAKPVDLDQLVETLASNCQ